MHQPIRIDDKKCKEIKYNKLVHNKIIKNTR